MASDTEELIDVVKSEIKQGRWVLLGFFVLSIVNLWGQQWINKPFIDATIEERVEQRSEIESIRRELESLRRMKSERPRSSVVQENSVSILPPRNVLEVWREQTFPPRVTDSGKTFYMRD